MKITKFRTNKQSEIDGVWVDAGEGLRLLIARQGNARYNESMRRHGSPLVPQIKSGSVSIDQAEQVTCRAMAETILLNWENLQDENGVNVPYSTDQAYKYLLEMRDFRDLVQELSNTVQNYREAQAGDMAGN